MKYLKIFEAKVKKDWEKMVVNIEDDFRNLINASTDITLDYIKDISASALDVFSGEKTEYDQYLWLEFNEETYVFMSKDGKVDDAEFGEADKSMYKDAVSFYKDLITTKEDVCLIITVDVYFNLGVSEDDPKVISLKEEIKDIESRCEGEGILFIPHLRMSKSDTLQRPHKGREKDEISLLSFGFEFRIKLDTSKMTYDYHNIISSDVISDFDKFISMYKIPKEGEDDLVKLISKSLIASKKK